MTILITGSTGFIGSNLVEQLSKNHQVYGLTRDDKIDKKYIKADLLDYTQSTIAIFNKITKVDVIIHLASRISLLGDIDNLSILSDNIQISQNLFYLAKRLNVEKIINFSSNAVYPNIDGTYDENSVIDPSNNTDCIYGLSKFNSEILLKYWCQKEDISFSNLRISQVYGKGMNQNRIIPQMEKELAENNTITVYGDGIRMINLTSIEFLLEKVNLFVEKNLHGTYNIGEKNISIMQLAEEIISQYGNENSTIIKEARGNKSLFKMDSSKLNTIIS